MRQLFITLIKVTDLRGGVLFLRFNDGGDHIKKMVIEPCQKKLMFSTVSDLIVVNGRVYVQVDVFKAVLHIY